MPASKGITNILFQNDFVEISFDADISAVVLTYKRSGSSTELRNIHFELLGILKRKQVARLLVNTIHLGVVAPDDQRWLGQTMVPLLAQATPGSYLFSAAVIPDKIFTQLAVQHIEQLSVGTGTCLNRHFTSVSEARKWLLRQGEALL